MGCTKPCEICEFYAVETSDAYGKHVSFTETGDVYETTMSYACYTRCAQMVSSTEKNVLFYGANVIRTEQV